MKIKMADEKDINFEKLGAEFLAEYEILAVQYLKLTTRALDTGAYFNRPWTKKRIVLNEDESREFMAFMRMADKMKTEGDK